jgi:hypothetical protein
MYKSNFNDIDQVVHMSIIHQTTEVGNAPGIVLYSQWLQGKEHMVSDCLSCNNNLSDTHLITMLRFFIPDQSTEDFMVSHLHKEITAFLFSLLQSPPETMDDQRHTVLVG